jgi:hypothetical protein
MVLEVDGECDEGLIIQRRPGVGGKVELAIVLLLYQVSKSLSSCEKCELILPLTSWQCVRKRVQRCF